MFSCDMCVVCCGVCVVWCGVACMYTIVRSVFNLPSQMKTTTAILPTIQTTSTTQAATTVAVSLTAL